MVHGTTYTIRYLLRLKNPIDYYDDLLPICIANRKMFKLLDDRTIIIFDEKDLGKRFDNKPLSIEYAKAINNELDEDINNKKYFHAYVYSSEIKIVNNTNYDTTKIYTKEEFNVMKLRHKEIDKLFWANNNLTDEDLKQLEQELRDISNILRYAPIFDHITGPEISEIERQLTNIELTDEEKKIIERVKSASCIKSTISDSNTQLGISNVEGEGFQLYSYKW